MDNAILYLKTIASEGNVEAQHKLGVLYHEGILVQRSYAEAIYWLKRAADKGNQYALTTLIELRSKM